MTIAEIISIIASILSIISVGIGVGKIQQKVVDLEKSVDKHNNVIERVFRLEVNIGHIDIGVLKAEQKHLTETVKKLQEDIQKCQNSQ